MLKWIYPVTKAKLHKVVTVVGVAFAVLAILTVWIGDVGLSPEGKVGATLGMVSTLLAGWKRAQPKIDAAIDELPIPEEDSSTK